MADKPVLSPDWARDAANDVSAHISQQLYDSPAGRATRAVSGAVDRTGKALEGAYYAAKERFFPARPEGRDVQLPRDKYSKRNFNPNRERKR